MIPHSESNTVKESSEQARGRGCPPQCSDVTRKHSHLLESGWRAVRGWHLDWLEKNQPHMNLESSMSYWPEPSNPHFNLGEKLRDVAPLRPRPLHQGARAPYGARAADHWSPRFSLPGSLGCRRHICTSPRPPGWRSQSGGFLMA